MLFVIFYCNIKIKVKYYIQKEDDALNIDQFSAMVSHHAEFSRADTAASLFDAFQQFFQPQVMQDGITDSTEDPTYDMNYEMQLIDARYRAENTLLEAIAGGDEAAAFKAILDYGTLMQSPSQKAAPTSSDAIRDFKNSVHTMNTLFRKAIEGNHVHPIYIHESSSNFGSRIEQADSLTELALLIGEMLQRYCYLARTYSVAVYTEPIRRAILYIDLNLATPISTKDIAADQFLSPNYLSGRFHEETGKTISDFVLEKRIKMACKLLKTTKLSIQEVAASVGIGDASYFSKQFKKLKGMSPLQYQKRDT